MKLSLKTTLPAAAIAMIGYAVLMSGANASATSQLNNCRFDTKQKVVDCCQRVLRHEPKPYWMVESGGSCKSVAKCVGRSSDRRGTAVAYVAKKSRCFVNMQQNNEGGGETLIKIQNRPDRGNFIPSRGQF